VEKGVEPFGVLKLVGVSVGASSVASVEKGVEPFGVLKLDPHGLQLRLAADSWKRE